MLHLHLGLSLSGVRDPAVPGSAERAIHIPVLDAGSPAIQQAVRQLLGEHAPKAGPQILQIRHALHVHPVIVHAVYRGGLAGGGRRGQVEPAVDLLGPLIGGQDLGLRHGPGRGLY